MAKKIAIVGGSTVSLTFTVDDTTVEVSLDRFRNRLDDFRRFWSEFWAPQFFSDIRRNFTTQGGLVGGWRALSPAYAAWKRSVVGNKPILQFSSAMYRSFNIGDRNNYLRSMKARVLAGSRLDRVAIHHYGQGRVPIRKVLYVGPRRVYQPLLDQFVAEEMKAAGMPKVRGRGVA